MIFNRLGAVRNLPSGLLNGGTEDADRRMGMSMRFRTFVATVVVVLLGTIAFAQRVTYDFDRSANFASFTSYAWVRGSVTPDELNNARIVKAVDAQLAARGFKRVEASEAPDVLVAYHTSFDKDLQITGFSSGWGGYRFGPSRSATARTEVIVTGTLAVDMVDANTKTIVWRGLASKDLDVKADPGKRERNINKAVEKIFKNFPVAAK
jgi:hypothetical protein